MAEAYGVYKLLTGTDETAELETDPTLRSQTLTYRVHGNFTGTVYLVLRRPDEVTGEVLALSQVTDEADKLVTVRGPYFVKAACSGLIGAARVELFGNEDSKVI